MFMAQFKQRCWRLCHQTGTKALHTQQAIRYSLKLRLILLFWLLAFGVGFLFWGGMQKAFSIGWREAARPLLMDYVDRLTAELGTPPNPERAAALVAQLPITLRIDGPQVQWQSHPTLSGRELTPERTGTPRVLERMTADGHRIEWGLSAEAFTHRPRLAWLVLLGLLILTAWAYVMVRRWLRPLDDIGAGAERFGAGQFDAPIPIPHAHAPDELGQLAHTINVMGQDIHQMLEAKRSLLLAISHELRSPLTRARLHAELLPESADLQIQRDGLMRDLDTMAQLINDLLESERLSGHHRVLHREWTAVAELVQQMLFEDAVLQRIAQTTSPASLASHTSSPDTSTPRPLADVHIAPDMPALCHLDPQRVRVLLRNLLLNALRYGQGLAHPPEIELTWVAASSQQATEGGMVHIRLRDFGPGVEAAQLPHLGQAFYRPDSARSRETGGVGLGLYLCRLIAQAHGGEMEIRNAHPGLEVRVSLRCEGDCERD